jgi:two-component system, NtrC family, sensor kinase
VAALYSLKFRIAATIFLLEGLMMVFVLWQVIGHLNDSADKQLTAQEQVALDLMGALGRTAIFTSEYADMQPYFDNIKRDPRVVMALLADSNGKVVAGTDISILGKNISALSPKKNAYWRENKLSGSSGPIGKLIIEFSNATLLEAQSHAKNLGITIAAVGMIAIASIGLLMGWILTKRLEQLTSAAEQLSAGNLKVRTNMKGRDEVAMLSATFNEMAERLASEQEKLRLANEELESKVSQRTSELTAALAHLKQAQEEIVQQEKLASLGALVAGIAHELNTPLGIGVTAASSIHDRTLNFQNDINEGAIRRSSLDEYINFVNDGSSLLLKNLDRASKLITNFKQIAVDQSSDSRRKFNLRETVLTVMNMLSPLLKKHQHSIEVEVDPNIVMDSYPGPFEQIITNMITNSLKHAFKNITQGKITISASLFDENQVEIYFSDNGSGISPENLPKIFDPFFTTEMGNGGSGLGLNIVHNLATGTLGGRLDVESKVNSGTTFRLKLPLVKA